MITVFEEVCGALDGGFRYVAVGGGAVVLHGYPRLTADLDLVIDLAPEQAAAERLTWLQEAILFARRAGALEDERAGTEQTLD